MIEFFVEVYNELGLKLLLTIFGITLLPMSPFFIISFIRHKQFKHTGNPYKRFCRKCGQQQDFYTHADLNDSRGWWEDMGIITVDENCICHKYSTYHGAGYG